jgi:hypothetical protein
MSLRDTLRSGLERLQTYAFEYFSTLYKASVCFWSTPPLPTGANVLTGAFAFFMIYAARRQFSQPTDAETMAQIVFYGTLVVIIASGILVVFDPLFAQKRVSVGRKLVSNICIGSILGCIFIVLDSIIPWINVVFSFASSENLIWEANLLVSAVAAILAFLVLAANSISRFGLAPLREVRPLAWSAVVLVLLFLGVHLLVTRPL